MTKPLSESKFCLVTTGGYYHKGVDPPFDVEREKREPTWGDPSFRTIPIDISPDELGASHLHINTRDPLADINILLPVDRFKSLVEEGRVGSLASNMYSFMGYQGFPPDQSGWREVYGPQVAGMLKDEQIDCVLLTPA